MAKDKNHTTIFCNATDIENWGSIMIRQTIMLTYFALNLFVIWYLNKQKNQHPNIQRAPNIGIFHLMLIFLLNLILYLVEITGYSYNWDTDAYGAPITSAEQIPFSRKLIKVAVFTLNNTFYGCYEIRIIVIWCQWKVTEGSNRLHRFFTRERNGIKFISFMISMATIMGYLFGLEYFNFYTSLSWFSPQHVLGYKLLHSWNLYLFEIALLIFMIFLMLNFPSNFKLKNELIVITSVSYVTTYVLLILKTFNIKTNEGRYCYYPYISVGYIFQLIKSYATVLTVYYYSRPTILVPATPVKLLTNFKVFMSNELCSRTFFRYISEKHGKMLPQLEKYMVGAIQNQSYSEEEYDELNDKFIGFQDTWAFDKLRTAIGEYESVYYLKFKTEFTD